MRAAQPASHNLQGGENIMVMPRSTTAHHGPQANWTSSSAAEPCVYASTRAQRRGNIDPTTASKPWALQLRSTHKATGLPVPQTKCLMRMFVVRPVNQRPAVNLKRSAEHGGCYLRCRMCWSALRSRSCRPACRIQRLVCPRELAWLWYAFARRLINRGGKAHEALQPLS